MDKKTYFLSDGSYKLVLIVLIPALICVSVTKVSTQLCSIVVLRN